MFQAQGEEGMHSVGSVLSPSIRITVVYISRVSPASDAGSPRTRTLAAVFLLLVTVCAAKDSSTVSLSP